MTYQDLFQHQHTSEYIAARRTHISHVILSGLRLIQDYRAVRAEKPKDWFKEFARHLIWQNSKISGYYVGNQYWSIGAADAVLAFRSETRCSLRGAANQLRKAANDERRITHEHVYPVSQCSNDLFNDRHVIFGKRNPINEINDRLIRCGIGCIVLQSEHPGHGPDCGLNAENPWKRYKQHKIQLVPNPNWEAPHLGLIKEHELADPAHLDPQFLPQG